MKLCAMLNASIISVVIVIMRYCVSLIVRREWHNNNKRWAGNILVFRPRSRKLRPQLPRGRLVVRAGYYKIISLRIKSLLRHELMSNIPTLLYYILLYTVVPIVPNHCVTANCNLLQSPRPAQAFLFCYDHTRWFSKLAIRVRMLKYYAVCTSSVDFQFVNVKAC